MGKVRSRLIVIDASVARASGDQSMHPTARNCREFLDMLLRACHRVAMTSSIQAEWDAHQSRFARTWRVRMMGGKKIEYVQIDPHHSLETRLRRVAKDPSILAIMEKDRHLIEAALVTDRRVVSLDERVREHFRAHHPALREIREICWANPDITEQQLLAWLERGAPADRSLMLGHRPPELEEP